MSAYTDPELYIKFKEDGRVAVLLNEIVYELDHKGSGEFITIPKGFETDGVSVPRIVWSILPPWGTKASKAAIIHDYAIDMLRGGTPIESLNTYAKIHREFLTAMLAVGIPYIRAYLIYLAVRTIGPTDQ